MTPNMRDYSLRYGDVLCLDMQAREYDSSAFPYCSGSPSKYLAIWLRRQLRRQIIGSVGKLGFCGSSIGK
jgi:hypothetical protein